MANLTWLVKYWGIIEKLEQKAGGRKQEMLPLPTQLTQLRGEPYFSRAQELIEALSPVKRQWAQKDYQSMLGVLTEQTREIEIWRRRVKEEYEGVGFGRYNLS